MKDERESIIAGELCCVLDSLRTCSPDALCRIARDVGAHRWRELVRTLTSVRNDRQTRQ